MMWGYGFGWGGILMMILGSVLLIAVIAVVIWAIIHWANGKTTGSTLFSTSTPSAGPSALEILRQRYARGEIDTATYEQMRERLGASNARED